MASSSSWKEEIRDTVRKEVSRILGNTMEKACTKEPYKILLARTLCEFFPTLRFLSDLVPTHLPGQYQGEMSMQSDVIPLPVLMKDEI